MRFFTFLFVLLFSFLSNAQDLPGYYINSIGQRTEGFFKKSYFADASSLEFKVSSVGEYNKLNPSDIIEYGVGDEYKVVKHSVKMDNSISTTVRKISNSKEPVWEKKTIFLNILLEGEASLYSYVDDIETKYFYTVKGKVAEPAQLVNRKYIANNNVYTDASFRKELYANIKCEGDSINDFLKIAYTKNELVEVFKKYNNCIGSSSNIFSNSSGSESHVSFSVFAGANMSSFHLKHDANTDSDSQVTPGLGAEALLTFPSGKWGVFARLDFETIKGTVSETFNPGFQLITDEYKLDAKYLNLVVGPRYFIIPKLYVDVAAGMHLGFGEMTYQKFIDTGNAQSASDLVSHSLAMNFFATAGAGFKVTNNWSVEVRYDLPRGVLGKEIGPDLTTQRMGAAIKYTFN